MSETARLADAHLATLIRLALEEDIGDGDITGEATVPADRRCLARIKAKAPGVIAGIRVAEAVFHAVDPGLDFEAARQDGSRVVPGDHVAVIGGAARSLLAAERIALNFLQRLSGIATATATAVALVEGTGVRLLDTRKTTPGMRALEKYAVACGGGVNHRQGLFDRYLIKENHAALGGGIGAAIRAARAARPGAPVEIEVRGLEELAEALAERPERVLLDNFSPADAAEAVRRVAGGCETEVSGGVTPDNLRAYAAARPDFISLGWLTHSAPALDLSMTLVAP
jgi:nicotinate-nucleotide pyrophosphorylase (carboxylating)